MTPLWLWPVGALAIGGMGVAFTLDIRACRCQRHRCVFCRREVHAALACYLLACLCAIAPALIALVGRYLP